MLALYFFYVFVLNLVSFIGADDWCKKRFKLCPILSFYRPIIELPLCLHDLGLECNYGLWETVIEKPPCVLAYHFL